MNFADLLKLVGEEGLEIEGTIGMLLDKLNREAVAEVKTAKGWLEHWGHHAFGLDEAIEACQKAKLIWRIYKDLIEAHENYLSKMEDQH